MLSFLQGLTFLFSTNPRFTDHCLAVMGSSIEQEKRQESSLHEYSLDEVPSADDAAYTKREAATVWKLDCFIAPVMMLLMLISYLDRGNIGFAATQGMTTAIHLKGNQLNVRHTINPLRCLC